MNFFFTINTSYFSSVLTIPKFYNTGKYFTEPTIVSLDTNKLRNKWEINEFECDQDKNFFYIESHLTEKKFFSILEKKYLNKSISITELLKFFEKEKKVTSFRSNLKLITRNNSFSSYQSEYPFRLIKTKSNILSPLKVLGNKNQLKSFLIFPNISMNANKIKNKGKIINENKIILKELILLTNCVNIVDITNLDKNSFFCSYGISGIPIFVSLDVNGNISMEHTHPPHAFLDIDNKFSIINKFKNKFK